MLGGGYLMSMRGWVILAVAMLGALAGTPLGGLAFAQKSGAAVAVRSCGTLTYGDMKVRLKVRGRLSCASARRVARRYANKVDGGAGCSVEGGNTCPLAVGGFRCTTPTAGSLPLVLSCSSRRLKARIKGYEVTTD